MLRNKLMEFQEFYIKHDIHFGTTVVESCGLGKLCFTIYNKPAEKTSSLKSLHVT